MKNYRYIMASLMLALMSMNASAQDVTGPPPVAGPNQDVVTTPKSADGSPPAAANPAASAPHFGRLRPEEIQALQAVGVAVLGAKAGQRNDASTEDLKTELQALAIELDQITQVPDAVQIGQPNTKNDQNSKGSDNDSASILHARLKRIDGKRKIEHDKALQSGDQGKIASADAHSKKVDELTQEVSDALATTDEDRIARLTALRARLQLKKAYESRSNIRDDAASVQANADMPMMFSPSRHR